MSKEETKYCWTCERNLTPENTQSYKGFDEGNYKMSLIYAGGMLPKNRFEKCDSCFDADIDSYLENLYN